MAIGALFYIMAFINGSGNMDYNSEAMAERNGAKIRVKFLFNLSIFSICFGISLDICCVFLDIPLVDFG